MPETKSKTVNAARTICRKLPVGANKMTLSLNIAQHTNCILKNTHHSRGACDEWFQSYDSDKSDVIHEGQMSLDKAFHPAAVPSVILYHELTTGDFVFPRPGRPPFLLTFPDLMGILLRPLPPHRSVLSSTSGAYALNLV